MISAQSTKFFPIFDATVSSTVTASVSFAPSGCEYVEILVMGPTGTAVAALTGLTIAESDDTSYTDIATGGTDFTLGSNNTDTPSVMNIVGLKMSGRKKNLKITYRGTTGNVNLRIVAIGSDRKIQKNTASDRAASAVYYK